METTDIHPSHSLDPQRFLEAQEEVWPQVGQELQEGRKRSHWMWFVFPQLDGLGHSSLARFYALQSLEQARAYLAHPVLGMRLRTCTSLTLKIQERSAVQIFGDPDWLKFRSCMTLFAHASEPGSPFAQALQKYFHGEEDSRTLEILERRSS